MARSEVQLQHELPQQTRLEGAVNRRDELAGLVDDGVLQAGRESWRSLRFSRRGCQTVIGRLRRIGLAPDRRRLGLESLPCCTGSVPSRWTPDRSRFIAATRPSRSRQNCSTWFAISWRSLQRLCPRRSCFSPFGRTSW